MKKKQGVAFIPLFMMIVIIMTACGNTQNEPTNVPNEPNKEDDVQTDVSVGTENNDFFSWDETTIIGLTDSGAVQENLVIPDKCTGFDYLNFSLSNAKAVSFEGSGDVKLNRCFTSDAKIEKIILPDNLSEIGDMEFMSCTSLAEIIIPKGVETLGESAFSGCTSLKNVSFQTSGLSKIGDYAFQICPIETVSIPEGVKEIGEYSFYQCDQLKKIYLPSSLKTIGAMGFGAKNIEEVHFNKDTMIDDIDPMAFGTSVISMTIYISVGSWMDENRQVWDIGFGSIEYE